MLNVPASTNATTKIHSILWEMTDTSVFISHGYLFELGKKSLGLYFEFAHDLALHTVIASVPEHQLPPGLLPGSDPTESETNFKGW